MIDNTILDRQAYIVDVELVFYGPSTLLGSFQAWSVNLSTLFPGSLPILSAHSFTSNRQLPFSNQQKGQNGRRNFFTTKSPQKNVCRT